MSNNLYGGYSGSHSGAARHTLTRRRTLKKKSVLLKQYGFRSIVAIVGLLGIHMINKRINPPEFKSQEEQQKSEMRFGLFDMWQRMVGYIDAVREKNQNQQDKLKIYVPKEIKSNKKDN